MKPVNTIRGILHRVPGYRKRDRLLHGPFMLDQVIHPTDCMRFFMGQVSEVYATGTVDAASSTVSMSVNLRYENGGMGTMTLGTGPVLEAMVFVKGTGNQAIQVLETRRLRRYRMPTWLDAGGWLCRYTH